MIEWLFGKKEVAYDNLWFGCRQPETDKEELKCPQ
jgi:hypothetical protein